MHIFEVFCALAVALLCSDVEAKSFTTGGLKVEDRGAKNVEGAFIGYVQLKSGQGTTVFPTLKNQYKVRCNGNCRNLIFEAKTDQNVMLALAEWEPAFAKKGGCYNCVCTSTGGNPKECKNSAGKSRFSLNSDKVYITLVPNNKLKDVVAYLRGDNIKSVEDDESFGFLDAFVSKNGKMAVVTPIKGPFTKAKRVTLTVYCKDSDRCKNVKIEVFSDSLVKSVVGKSDKVNSCKGVKSCATTFDPALIYDAAYDPYYYFYVEVGLDPSNRHFLAYVKVSGDNVAYIYVDYVDDY